MTNMRIRKNERAKIIYIQMFTYSNKKNFLVATKKIVFMEKGLQ